MRILIKKYLQVSLELHVLKRQNKKWQRLPNCEKQKNYYLIKEIKMAARMFSNEQRAKLTQIINEGVGVLQEIEDLNAGLSDTVKAVAEEMEIKPAILKKAIKIAQKSKLGDTNADHEELNTILETVGRTL
jgi:hypothetical protein